MTGVLKLDIQESAEELKALLSQQSSAVERSKVQILWWLKQEQVRQVNELAQLSGYHRITISRWLSRYRQGGLEALLACKPKPGRPRAIDGEVREQLAQELEDPEGFASYREVQQWLAAMHDQVVPYKTVHKTVRYGLKGKLKRPRPVFEKQEVGTVEAFEETLEH
ncbi:helix-turn-helix domain-containing protein [Gloeocapsopsis crepidinum LEGE 06123]|uniref:Helix-turn-helix domain-containing protein n=1 Tax=Gloeocapsopsis crepidinum LEGE 06123 TaxID=588587 RepID=A0ABR9USJ0_9CHRO|nr:helix-turn-helix domain-containing protein [Gloeocapsopsis crepidinum]MBE9190993.1 helix-turn-helix domain-containing protein [Gloeocapsopsis crepidinum LEGE 06123]